MEGVRLSYHVLTSSLSRIAAKESDFALDPRLEPSQKEYAFSTHPMLAPMTM